jgi:hypothetical protein
LPALPVRISIPVLAVVALAAGATPAVAAAPTLATSRGCYLVGQPVAVHGSGFAANRTFTVTIDDIYFGTSTTDASGAFSTSLRPGGLGANQPQLIDHLAASDGSAAAQTVFTVTRTPGARFLASAGNVRTLRARFQVWGFSRTGSRLPLYLHYVSGSGRLHKSVSLGHTGGQCGYLLTTPRRVFPFTPTAGSWTLQVDTHRGYERRPSGPVARIGVRIG